jgi:hypothetical protein
MKRLGLGLVMGVALLAASQVSAEIGQHGARTALRHARMRPWHGNYYHTGFGSPIGLVVPPTARMQTKMGWGVSQSEMVPIYHEAFRAYPGEYGGSTMTFSATPNWPSHTDQFGVYYIRGPW